MRRIRRFKIPDEIRVRGKRWLIIRDHEILDFGEGAKLKKELRGYFGLTDHNRRVIYLTAHKTRREEAETFLHELMHACGRGLRWRSEERFICAIERPFLEALEQLTWE